MKGAILSTLRKRSGFYLLRPDVGRAPSNQDLTMSFLSKTFLRVGMIAFVAGPMFACSPEAPAPRGLPSYGGNASPGAPSGTAGVATGSAGILAHPPGAPAGSLANVPVAGSAPLPVAGATGGDVSESTVLLPCDVSKALAKNCGQCHGASPVFGAPMSLVTYADLMKPSVKMPSMKVADAVKLRINDTQAPMPPGGGMAAQELTMLNGWLSSGMPAGTAADATCAGGTQDKSTVQLAPDYPGLTELPGEKCYEFKVHNSTTEIDNTPYPIPMGEHYANFYFKAP
ncbi:MAG: hypothetical protein RL701_6751 [Pseudomonadota bacterium]